MRVSYAIVYVSDMKRAVSFYRDVLGLPLRFESPAWTEFATDGATLALHASRSDDDDDLPPGGCRPGLSVPNLDDFHRRLMENNVRCTQEPKVVFGARVAQYVDPDGLRISVGEERRGTEQAAAPRPATSGRDDGAR
jgi:lactoylglutathione lyase